MLDAFFIQHAAKALNEAARVRATYPAVVAAVTRYGNMVSLGDKRRELDRVKRHVRNLIKTARYYNARAKLHTQGENLLIAAQAMDMENCPNLAKFYRTRAAKFFDAVDRVPPPDLE